MKQVIVITGASSGFGALTARALAHAGHVVYAPTLEGCAERRDQIRPGITVATHASEVFHNLRRNVNPNWRRLAHRLAEDTP